MNVPKSRLGVVIVSYDTLVIHDDAYVRARPTQPIAHHVHTLVHPARRDIPLGDVGHAGRTGLHAFAGEAAANQSAFPG